MANKQTSFTIDDRTEKLLDELKEKLGVSSRGHVLRKALALTQIAVANSNPTEHTVTLKSPDGEEKIIMLQG